MDRHTTKQNKKKKKKCCNLGSVMQRRADALRSKLPGSCVLGRRGNHAGEQCSKVTSIVCCVSDVMRMTSKVFRSRAESGVLELWCLKD